MLGTTTNGQSQLGFHAAGVEGKSRPFFFQDFKKKKSAMKREKIYGTIILILFSEILFTILENQRNRKQKF